MLAVYAGAYGRWRLAMENIREKGLTVETARGETTNPAVGVMATAERTMVSVLGLFGLNPSDRGRLRATEGPAEDEFEKFKREHAS